MSKEKTKGAEASEASDLLACKRFWDKGNRVRMMFGDGRILVSPAHNGNGYENMLALAVMNEKVSVGEDLPQYKGMRSDQIGGAVVELEFKNTTSVQVVIRALQKIKREIAEHKIAT